MQAQQVGSLSARWEEDLPAYRVYFWETTVENPGAGWASDEWRLNDADIEEVLAWATQHANGRYLTIWVELEVAGQTGLVRLSGWEPVRRDAPPEWVAPWT